GARRSGGVGEPAEDPLPDHRRGHRRANDPWQQCAGGGGDRHARDAAGIAEGVFGSCGEGYCVSWLIAGLRQFVGWVEGSDIQQTDARRSADYRSDLSLSVAPPRARHFFLFAQEKVTKKKGTPTSGPACGGVPSLRCRSGGRLTRAIHGPLSLSPHPCGSSPCATPPLGLLTGASARLMHGCATADRHASARSLQRMGPGLGPSEGRMESLCKGLSGMDAARGAMGQGWPFATGPWKSDGMKEPRARSDRGRMPGALLLWLLSSWASKKKVTRPGGRN